MQHFGLDGNEAIYFVLGLLYTVFTGYLSHRSYAAKTPTYFWLSLLSLSKLLTPASS
jgi:hypothetical protein